VCSATSKVIAGVFLVCWVFSVMRCISLGYASAMMGVSVLPRSKVKTPSL